MHPRLLLDTHVLVRWISESKKLSREQVKAIERSLSRGELLTFCAISLLETAVLASQGKLKLRMSLNDFFDELQTDASFRVLPITYEVASEAALLAALRDPADRAIVATARVHRLTLVTSDQRIIESKLVAVVA